jgi:transposase-like protein
MENALNHYKDRPGVVLNVRKVAKRFGLKANALRWYAHQNNLTVANPLLCGSNKHRIDAFFSS